VRLGEIPCSAPGDVNESRFREGRQWPVAGVNRRLPLSAARCPKVQKVLDNVYCVPYSVLRTVGDAQYMAAEPNLFENLRLELRRGSLVLAVLAQLRTEQYGYTLRKALADHGMEIDEGTLYPLLRRLESQGLLVSEWREEDKRNKRFYVLSANGKQILKQLRGEWKSIDSSLNGIVKG